MVYGDSLWSIAKKYNITVSELKSANNLSSNLLSIGQKLVIPTEEETDTYTVKSGDTLYSISQKYNISVDKLKDINNLSSNVLSIGQKLKVTDDEESNQNTYTVVKGDSLYSIAKKYNTTVDILKSLNNLSSSTLRIGQILNLPSTNTYTVVKGDSLYSIAKKYDTTVDTLKSLNNLENSTLSIGQKLLLP